MTSNRSGTFLVERYAASSSRILSHDQSHFSTQSTGTGTHSPSFSGRTSQSRTLGARRSGEQAIGQNYLGCGPGSDCCGSTCSLGKDQRTESRFNHPSQIHDVTCRSETHRSRSESSVGEVAQREERIAVGAIADATERAEGSTAESRANQTAVFFFKIE